MVGADPLVVFDFLFNLFFVLFGDFFLLLVVISLLDFDFAILFAGLERLS